MMKTELLLETTAEFAAPVSTLCDMFDRAVATTPRTVALRHLGVALTYQEMGRAVAALARRLSLTLVPGEVIALVLPNSIEFQIAFIHIPGGAKHAWRNVSGEPMAALITCTAKLGRALREMGQLASEAGKRIPRPADIQRLMEISERYGYWLGSREENTAVGIELA